MADMTDKPDIASARQPEANSPPQVPAERLGMSATASPRVHIGELSGTGELRPAEKPAQFAPGQWVVRTRRLQDLTPEKAYLVLGVSYGIHLSLTADDAQVTTYLAECFRPATPEEIAAAERASKPAPGVLDVATLHATFAAQSVQPLPGLHERELAELRERVRNVEGAIEADGRRLGAFERRSCGQGC